MPKLRDRAEKVTQFFNLLISTVTQRDSLLCLHYFDKKYCVTILSNLGVKQFGFSKFDSFSLIMKLKYSLKIRGFYLNNSVDIISHMTLISFL